MLSIGPINDKGADYYLEKVASGVEDYYLGHGEAPGRWIGAGCADFGVEGPVDGAVLRAVLSGDHPRTLEHLAAGNRKVDGWDFCFRAPKSVSLLFGLGDAHLAGTVVAAHEEAVEAAFAWVEREALRSRRGHSGVEIVHTSGFAGAAFRHRTSRAGDPHLHTHVVTPNLVKGTDGTWATPHSNLFHHLAATAGYLYESHLRAVLVEELGVEWEDAVNGIGDVAGVNKDVRDAFSKRSAEIKAYLKAVGHSSLRAAEIAALATRRAKDYNVDGHNLRARWLAEAEGLGFTSEALAARLHRVAGRQPPGPDELETLAAALSSPGGLTEQVSAFTRHDVLRAFSGAFAEGATVAEVEAWADAYLCRSELRHLPGHSRKVLAPFHTTADMLAVERSALSAVADRRDVGWGVVPQRLVADALAARPSLTFEQVGVIEALTLSGHGVEALVAAAGTGKTFSLDAAREAWEGGGRAVLGCALAGRTAQRLSEGSGIPSSTIAALLFDLEGEHSRGLPAGSVLVVDEAGMVGTRTLARLIEHAGRAQVKVVLVGDPYQLPEIAAEGMIRGIEARFEVLTLKENRRQRHGWERAALSDLRHGRVGDAIAAYDANDRVVRGENAIAVREAMVGDWWAARLSGEDAVMLASRHFDVDDLNARARVRVLEAGRLSGPELVLGARPYQAGDEVMTLRNNKRVGVLNGTLGTVTNGDATRCTIALRTTSGKAVTLPTWYLDEGHIVHAYAVTMHKAQGMTTDRCLVLGTDDLSREMGYTAMSRGKEANHLYVVGGAARDPDDHHVAPEAPDPDQVVFAALERSRAKSLALEELSADPARRLRALHAERRRLAPVVADAPPDPEPVRAGLEQARTRALGALADAEATMAAVKARPGRRRPKPRQAWAIARFDEVRSHLAEIDAEVALSSQRVEDHREYLADHGEELTRASAVEGAIATTLARRVAEVEAFRPPYLVAVIGEPPEHEDSRPSWRRAASLIEDQRAALGVDDDGSVLGPEPLGAEQLADWRAAIRDLAIAKALAGPIRAGRVRDLPGLEPDLGMGMEL